MSSLAAAALMSGLGWAASAADARSFRFDIVSEPVAQALRSFARVSKEELIFTDEVVRNLKPVSLQGEFTAEAALERLLNGTGLVARRAPSGAIRIVKEAAQGSSSAAGPAGQMLLASAAENPKPQERDNAASDSQQVVVKDRRIEPFQTTNADIPRTVDDVQPYYIFDAETITRSGAPNLEAFLKQRLTMNTIALTGSQNTGGNGDLAPDTVGTMGNTSSIDLRGLGTDKTLVLINGRRQAGVTTYSDTSGQTDINGIPLGAIERIEVLPSSASGIYGGNAIGGVVNVILKSEYQGGEVRLGYDNSWRSNSARRELSATYGMSLEGGRTHIMASGQWSETDPMALGARRDLYERNVRILRAGQPGWFNNSFYPLLGGQSNFVKSGSGNLIFKSSFGGGSMGASIGSVGAGLSPSATPDQVRANLLANAGVYNDELPDSTQYPTGLRRRVGVAPTVRSLHLNLRRQMIPDVEAFLEFTDTRNESESMWNPIQSYITIPASSPVNPFTTAVRLIAPNTMEKPSLTASTVRALTAGVKARLPLGWLGQLEYTRSESSYESLYYGMNALLSEWDPASHLFSGAFNPFVDVQQYPIDMNPYVTPAEFSGSTRTADLALRGSGPLFSLPWGRPRLTVGLQHYTARTPPKVQTFEGDSTVTYYAREQSVISGYAETLVPLVAPGSIRGVQALELQLSGRAERFTVDTGTYSRMEIYSVTPTWIEFSGPTDNGQPLFSEDTYSSSNHTVGLKYQPLPDVTLRLSQATAFLPPGPNQLTRDPNPRGNGAYVSADPGNPQHSPGYVPALTGGNPNLLPQTSESFNAGVIWRPLDGRLNGLRLNLEYYRIEQINAIVTPSATMLLGNEDMFADRITRDGSGRLVLLDLTAINQYSRLTEGMDFSVDYRAGLPRGALDLRLAVSHVLKLRNQYALNLPAYEAAGYSPAEGGAPDYKAALTLNWSYQQLNLGWTTSFVDAYKQYGAAGGPLSSRSYGGNQYSYIILGQGSDTIPSQSYHDLFLSYAVGQTSGSRMGTLLADSTLTLGVRNVFDKAPPYDAQYRTTYFHSPYGDLRLRSYWLNFSRQF